MSLPAPRRLASFVAPDLGDRRIDRVWAAVSRRPVRAPYPWRLAALPATVAVALTAAVAAVVVLSTALRARTATPLAGWTVESGEQQIVSFPDGTSAALHRGARVRWDRVVADRLEATVERGAVAFDVRHDASRAFVVHAAGIDIVDRGTRFVVDVEGSTVSVSVEQGRVDVSRAGASPVALGAGDAWTSRAPTATQPEAVPGEAPAASTAETGSNEPASTRGGDSRDSVAASPSAPDLGSKAPAEPRVTAQDLFETANDARLLGRPREAAAAFDALRRRFRNDRRAGLAAFELARLRLDALDDPAGAVEALTDTVALAPTAPFREDADARLVEALDRTHDVPRCEAAQRNYIARYPRGLHAAVVASRCH